MIATTNNDRDVFIKINVMQNKKDAKSTSNTNVQKEITQLVSQGVSILDMKEITKHNSKSDCWILVDGKVYDITSYFGSHPGGNSTMSATCGKDATDAYKTKDPYATSPNSGSNHSSRARSLLNNYYIGDLNQKIDQKTMTQNIQKAKSVPAPASKGGEYEDD